VKPGEYLRREFQKGTVPLRQAPALPTNIRLVWKDLFGTNTLAYLASDMEKSLEDRLLKAEVERRDNSEISGLMFARLFSVVIKECRNKLECLSLAGFSSLF